MISANILLGLPTLFDKYLYIYPPLVRDVADNPSFWSEYKALTLSAEEIEDELVAQNADIKTFPTPLEFLLNNSYHDKAYEHLVLHGIKQFCHSEALLLYETKQIYIGDINTNLANAKEIEDLMLIDESNFFRFQNALRAAVGEKKIELPKQDEDPRVKRIKAKARYRDKIKAKKGLGLEFTASLAAICCMNMGLNPLNIGEISYASIGILMRMYQDKEKYETDIRSIQAGAKANKINPIYWIRNLD